MMVAASGGGTVAAAAARSGPVLWVFVFLLFSKSLYQESKSTHGTPLQ
jgi:hypothetical protein